MRDSAILKETSSLPEEEKEKAPLGRGSGLCNKFPHRYFLALVQILLDPLSLS